MKVIVDLLPSEVAYMKEFKNNLKLRPLNKRELNLPSVQIFLRISEALDEL